MKFSTSCLKIAFVVLAATCMSATTASTFAQDTLVATLYADGSIECSGADDLSDPSGSATLLPVAGGVFSMSVLRAANRIVFINSP